MRVGSVRSEPEEARSRPTIDGWAFAFSRSAFGSLSTVEMTPRMAPLSLIRRVRARVSMPSMPRTPALSRVAARDSSLAQLLWYGVYSRTRTAAAWAARGSSARGGGAVGGGEGLLARPVAVVRGVLADEDGGGLDVAGLLVAGDHAVVAYERVGEEHDLAPVGRVGDRLLRADRAGREGGH